MPKQIYVAVDSNNRWLAYGEFDTPEECLVEAKENWLWRVGEIIYVYEVASEHVYTTPN